MRGAYKGGGTGWVREAVQDEGEKLPCQLPISCIILGASLCDPGAQAGVTFCASKTAL